MRNSLLFSVVTMLAVAPAPAQTIQQALADRGVQQVQQAFARGFQVYSCQLQAGSPKWIFLAPDATLYQGANGAIEDVATHSAGPVWEWIDGSGVFGRSILSVPAPAPNSIPWLLLQTQPFGTQGGVLSSVAFVTRTDTIGGITPTAGCDAVHIGTTARVPYSATYTFFATPAR